jgi:hypothetical protein
MDTYKIWEVVSYGWTEIGIEPDECERILAPAGIALADLPAVDRVIFKDVCASFSVDAFLVFPLMLWMLMPDWGYEESYLRRRVERWYSRPYWVHFLNPLRILGYPVALVFAWKYRSMLRDAIERLATPNKSLERTRGR